MPKNNKLAGHLRISIPLGDKDHKRGRPKSGWRLECLCGFHKEGLYNKRDLEEAYVQHIQESLPICSVCKETKAERFMSVACHTICKKCNTEKIKKWAKENPNAWERQKRQSHLKKKYNITIEEYDHLLRSQGGLCAICFKDPHDSRGFRPHIDHCHATGSVRGILCGACNKGLGAFKDNLKLLESSVLYLRKHQA